MGTILIMFNLIYTITRKKKLGPMVRHDYIQQNDSQSKNTAQQNIVVGTVLLNPT